MLDIDALPIDVREKILDPLYYIPNYLKIVTKADAHGISQLVPMNLWRVQEEYIRNSTARDVVLKYRQAGMSAGIMARNSHRAFTRKHHKMCIITHKADVSEFLLQTVHRFHNNLPLELKPDTDWKSGTRIRFPDIDSFIHIDTAESDAIGFGETLNIAHLSEISRWPKTKELDLFNGISQCVPIGGLITVESTPKGRRGLFYNLYQGAKKNENGYKAFFFPWWFDPNYYLPVPEKFEPFTKEEKLMMGSNGLVPGQIMFRRSKIAELKEQFYQEYPENDVDCWLAGDTSIFPATSIRNYMQRVWPGREDGNTTIWKDVIGGERYVIGVDAAAGLAKGDFSVAAVLNVKRNEYVARISGRIPPDLFAEQLMQLGKRYNNALIGVERASHGHAILKILLERNYPELFYHTDYDTVAGREVTEPGWRTNVKTKPIMVSSLVAAIRAEDIQIWSNNFFDEASGYIWDEDKKRATPFGHDDELDAVMIALQMREDLPVVEAYRILAPLSYASI